MAKDQFIPLALSQQGFKLGEFMPTGKAWENKNDSNTNMGALLLALGGEFHSLEALVQTVNKELDLNFTNDLIREWETSVGIPDDCFGIDANIENRRSQVITKIRNVRLQSAKDFKDLAALFGVSIQVFPGVPSGFPATDKEKRFSISIQLPGQFSGQVFPYPDFFPIPFVGELTSFIQCLFNKLKPANVQLVFEHGVNTLSNIEIAVDAEVSIDTLGVLGVLFDGAGGMFDTTSGLFDDI